MHIFRLPADRPITYWRGPASVVRPSSVRRPLAAGSQKPSQISFYNFTETLNGPISRSVFFFFFDPTFFGLFMAFKWPFWVFFDLSS